MNWQHIKTIWQKEILDTVRDRRTLVAGVLAPLIIMPLMSFGSWAVMRTSERRALEEKTPLAVFGAAEAPAFMALLDRSWAFRVVRTADGAGSLREGRIKLLVKIPPGFEREAMAGREPALLTVEYAAREVTAPLALDKFRNLLQAYQTMAQASRLHLRDPAVLEAVRLEERNTSTPREVGGMLLGFILPFALAVWGITGGMYTAIDAVAGEKERRTLETLVVAPPSRASLAAGKSLAVFTMSTLTILLSLASTFLTFRFGLPAIEKGGELAVTLEAGSVGLLMVVALPYLAMLAGLEITLSAYGKSFKETQNYFTVLMFAVMLPGMALSLLDRHLPEWLYALPFVNTIALFKDIFTLSWHWREIAISTAANLAYCALTLALAQRLLDNEKVLFKG